MHCNIQIQSGLEKKKNPQNPQPQKTNGTKHLQSLLNQGEPAVCRAALNKPPELKHNCKRVLYVCFQTPLPREVSPSAPKPHVYMVPWPPPCSDRWNLSQSEMAEQNNRDSSQPVPLSVPQMKSTKRNLTNAIHRTIYSSTKLLKYWSKNRSPGPINAVSWRQISLFVMWATYCKYKKKKKYKNKDTNKNASPQTHHCSAQLPENQHDAPAQQQPPVHSSSEAISRQAEGFANASGLAAPWQLLSQGPSHLFPGYSMYSTSISGNSYPSYQLVFVGFIA